jgi:hypothetical protein
MSVNLDEQARWKKRPLVESLDHASQDKAQIARWWQRWPEAKPGFRLAQTGLCIVDVDDVEEFPREPVCLGPHSHVATPSGGFQLVFAQPPTPISKIQWSSGIEILGTSCWAIGYDVDEWAFPHVAPRAVLPKWFWKPRDAGAERVPQQKVKDAGPPSAPVDGLLAALRQMDPCDWRNQHDEWLKLMTACCAEGIGVEDFVAWSIGDPVYRGDGPIIRRKWKSLKPKHGGALWAALSERGIKVKRAERAAEKSSLFVGAPSGHRHPSRIDRPSQIDWRIRFTGIIDWLRHHKTERDLFSASCLVAEIIARHHKPKPSFAVDFLEKAAKGNGLLEQLGADEIRRTIVNGLHHVEQKILAREEPQ